MYFISSIVAALAATTAVSAAPSGMNARDVAAARRERFMARHAALNPRGDDGAWKVDEASTHPNIPSPYKGGKGRQQNIVTAVGNNTYQTDYSGNWCGAVHTSPPNGQKFTTLQATWTMPTLQRPPGHDGQSGTWYGSQWVGIDGYTYGGAILQAGTTSGVTVNSDGSSYNSASAWFEWFPDPETEISLRVSPGDRIFCIITAYTSTQGNVYFKNQNTGEEFSHNFNAPSNNNALEFVNAEWIYEDFSAGGQVPFGQFSDTPFSGCNAGTTNGGVNLAGSTLVNMVTDGNQVCHGEITSATDMVVHYG